MSLQRQKFQKTLNKVMECEAELKNIQDQIERLEQIYLHHTWDEGNIVTGWNHSTRAVASKPNTKDKVFSLSSVTSNATHYLEEGVSKQLTADVEDCIKNKKRDRNYSLRRKRKQ